jgi:hypothetical protein
MAQQAAKVDFHMIIHQKRFDDCPSHFAVNVRIFPYIRIVSILATLIYSCCTAAVAYLISSMLVG